MFWKSQEEKMGIIPGLEISSVVDHQEKPYGLDQRKGTYSRLYGKPVVGQFIKLTFCAASDLVPIKRGFDKSIGIVPGFERGGKKYFVLTSKLISRDSDLEQAKAPYPGNTTKLVRFSETWVRWWELAIVVQENNIFITQQAGEKFDVCRHGNKVRVPKLTKNWPQFVEFAAKQFEQLQLMDRLPDCAQYQEPPKLELSVLTEGHARVLWFNIAMEGGHGILQTWEGKEVHVSWRHIVSTHRNRLRFLTPGEIVWVEAIEEVEFKNKRILSARGVKPLRK